MALFAILLRTHRITRFEIIYFCVLIPSIILHEMSHGVVALAFGDDTAKRAGRLTLNPAKHVDPVGTLLVPAVLSLSGLGAYGWAKPVPVSHQPAAQPPQPHRGGVAGRAPDQLRPGRADRACSSLTTPWPSAQVSSSQGLLPADAARTDPVHRRVRQHRARRLQPHPVPAPGRRRPCSSGSCRPASLPEYYRLQPLLMFLPFVLILVFHNQWSQLIGHVINWWSGLLV